jgi:hypothetical protein
MFMIEWIFDKMGYTKKVDWASVFVTYDEPKPAKKTVKRKPTVKKATTRPVRKKA